MRDQLIRWFQAGVRAADPAMALDRALRAEPPITKGRVFVISFGKAAVGMASTAMRHLAAAPAAAIAVTNAENAANLPGIKLMVAGHPIPDAGGVLAARAIEAVLAEAGPGDLVLALISGGGSAMLPAPVEGVSLEDKAEVSRLLLAAGIDITGINLVRQALSRLKGGGLLRAANGAEVRSYILSDVVGDDLRVVASGPTLAQIGSRSEAVALLQDHGLWDQIPDSVVEHLSQKEKAAKLPDTGHAVLIGSNAISQLAVRAAAEAEGVKAVIIEPPLVGEVGDAALRIIAAVRNLRGRKALIFGGETVVRLRGDGLGGRNQELALRVAIGLSERPYDWSFLSGGTDGRDGPTDAAGGIVDGGTLRRMRAGGLDPAAALSRNDSYHALQASGDLLMTGGTGTNVADLQIFMRD